MVVWSVLTSGHSSTVRTFLNYPRIFFTKLLGPQFLEPDEVLPHAAFHLDIDGVSKNSSNGTVNPV